MRIYCICTVVDCVVQDESFILNAANLGRKQIVELLIKATVGMDEVNEEDAKVSYLCCCNLCLPFRIHCE